MKQQQNTSEDDMDEPLVFEPQRIYNSPRLLTRLAKRVSTYLDNK